MNLKGLTTYQQDWLHSWLIMQVEPQEHDRLWPLVEASVGRIAANGVRRQNALAEAEGLDVSDPRIGRGAVQLALLLHAHFEHVLDWLRASLVTSAPWLKNVDERGRPKKLLKCSTYADLVREADKSMDRLNAQRAKSLGPGDEEHVADLEQGFSLVRLLTPAALDLESSRMRHCVGHGAYDRGVEDGSIEIYSLRDPLGRPVVTIEIERDTDGLDDYGILAAEPRTYRAIRQIQGRRNADPSREHMSLLKDYARQAAWSGRQYYWPFVIDVEGVEHDVHTIKTGAVLPSLEADFSLDRDLVLPEGLTVLGDAYFGSCIQAVPEGMTIHGNLTITAYRSPLRLPDSLQVGGKISVYSEEDVIAPAHLKEKVEVPRPRMKRFEGGQMFAMPRGQVLFRRLGSDAYETLGDLEDITLDVSGARTRDGDVVAEVSVDMEMQTVEFSPRFSEFLRGVSLGEAWSDPLKADEDEGPDPAPRP